MKALQQSWKWSLPGIVLYVALSAGTNALGADTPVQPAASPKGKAKAPIAADLPKAIGKAPAPGGAPVVSEPVKLRAFRLDHDDPINVMSTAQLLLTAPGGPLAGMVGGQGGFGPSMPGMQPGAQLVGGFGGLAGIGGGGQLGALGGGGQLGALGGGGQLGAFGGGGQLGALGGGGLGGFSGGVVNLAQAFGMAGGPPSNVAGASAGATRFAVDARTRTFLARGPERELQIVTDLITVLNTAPGKPLPKVKSLHVFKLKHAMPEDVAAAVA
jgi:hypothetical protein